MKLNNFAESEFAFSGVPIQPRQPDNFQNKVRGQHIISMTFSFRLLPSWQTTWTHWILADSHIAPWPAEVTESRARSLQAWIWFQILYNLSRCLNNQSATCFVVSLSDGTPRLKDGSDLAQNVRGFEVLKIPWGQETFSSEAFLPWLSSSAHPKLMLLSLLALPKSYSNSS